HLPREFLQHDADSRYCRADDRTLDARGLCCQHGVVFRYRRKLLVNQFRLSLLESKWPIPEQRVRQLFGVRWVVISDRPETRDSKPIPRSPTDTPRRLQTP